MNLEAKVLEIVNKFSINEGVVPEHTRNDLDIDSLDMVELAMECEETFNIGIEDHVLADIDTVQDLINIIQSRLGGNT